VATLELFREFLVEKKNNTAIDLVRFLSASYIRLAIQLVEQLRISELIPKLVHRLEIANQMEQEENPEPQSNMLNFSSVPKRRFFGTQQLSQISEMSGMGMMKRPLPGRRTDLTRLAFKPVKPAFNT
jgi:hypothetical protein